MKPREAAALRLVQTRIALGFESQAEFCKQIGVPKNVYNPFEKGKREITKAVALKIKKRFGVSLDWIIDGDPQNVSPKLYREIERAA